MTLTVINGPPFPADAFTIITSPAGLAALIQLVRANLAQVNSLAPPLLAPTIEEFGSGTLVELKRLVYRVLNGALAVAIDIDPKGVPLSTSGSVNQIIDFLGVGDIAVCVNPAMLEVMQRVIKPEIQAGLDKANTDVVLDDLWILPWLDHLWIGGHATKDIFGASFSLRAKPKLGTPPGTETWVDEYRDISRGTRGQARTTFGSTSGTFSSRKRSPGTSGRVSWPDPSSWRRPRR